MNQTEKVKIQSAIRVFQSTMTVLKKKQREVLKAYAERAAQRKSEEIRKKATKLYAGK